MKGVIIVTGASKGLGRAIAILLAKNGNTVIAIARQSSELQEVGEVLKSLSTGSIALPCDIGNHSDINSVTEEIFSRFKHISGIVHNAGIISPIKGMLDVDRSGWERAIQVNLIGVQDLTNSLEPIIGGDKHTRIVTISSGAAKRSIHGWSSYCVSKAGLDMWTNCLAEEGANRNISALAIAPGIVDTSMQAEIRDAEEINFPLLSNFIDYHRNGELEKPETIAAKLLPFCLGESGQNGDRLDVRNL